MSSNEDLIRINEALSESFFDVVERPIVTPEGHVIPGKKAICRADDGAPLSVVGSGYKTVANEEVFTSFTALLEKSKLDLEGAQVITEFSHDGARTFAQLILPSHTLKVGSGDETALRLIARNSYDGSSAFTVQAGGYRFVCSNGQIVGDSISYFRGKHVSSLDVKAAAQSISNVLGSFNRSQEWYSSLRSKKVNDKPAYACLAHASRNAEALQQGIPKSEEDMPRLMKTLFESWRTHRAQLGHNAWALYNTLTHFSTHHGTDREDGERHANSAAAKFRREDRVRETLSSKVWQKAAA